MCAIAYFILVRALIATHGADSEFAARIGSDWKGKIPLVAYSLGIVLAFVNVWISIAIYAGIAAVWFIPDRRFERT
jgi:uncharacterized membrane protein